MPIDQRRRVILRFEGKTRYRGFGRLQSSSISRKKGRKREFDLRNEHCKPAESEDRVGRSAHFRGWESVEERPSRLVSA
jgi:hypothetical protein